MKDNFDALKRLKYIGRSIPVAMTPISEVFVGYPLTGRSQPSQARELVRGPKTNTIRTNVTDREQLEKGSPALLLYPAIVPVDNVIVASNGAQTELLYSGVRNNPGLTKNVDGLKEIIELSFSEPAFRYDQKDDRWIDITTYEPDAPNNTPRISLIANNDSAVLYIVRCVKGEKDEEYHPFKLEPGKGKVITTYKGYNEDPLLPFTGEPLDIGIGSESVKDITESLYEAIYGGQNPGDNYRVAAAGMLKKGDGSFDTITINRSERGN
ncbi:MAG: hypothetical protein JSV92_01295 [archaeon]|nr:MAG: hypothetical protein JSV92_01295 [archaeon]